MASIIYLNQETNIVIFILPTTIFKINVNTKVTHIQVDSIKQMTRYILLFYLSLKMPLYILTKNIYNS